MSRLQGKVALITGAAGGMGATHARLFAQKGAKLVITDTLEAEGQQLAAELGENVLFVPHDVTSAEDWAIVLHLAEKRFGPVTVLVNNAGTTSQLTDDAELDYEAYTQVMALNASGTFLGMQAVIPSMVRAGIGSIVNISSSVGLQVTPGSSDVAYIGNSFTIDGLTKTAALEYAAHPIRINSVHPGAVKTGIVPMLLFQDLTILDPPPKQYFAEPQEIADLVLFLASDEALETIIAD